MADRIVIAGGSGFVGRAVAARLADDGFEVVTLTRGVRERTLPAGRDLLWDGKTAGDWEECLDGAHAVVNLAGESIEGLWTAGKRRAIRESRLDATRALVNACRRAKHPPRVFLQASAVGYYGAKGEGRVDESSPPGEGFLAEVARAWEHESAPVEALGVRRVILRLGIVVSPEGGIAGRLLPLFRLGLGGTPGDGRQPFPWIALEDAAEAAAHLARRDDLVGAFNLVAPREDTAADLTRALARAAGMPALFRAPAFLLRAALGAQADELLLGGRHVIPRRLAESGFRHARPSLDAALARAAKIKP